MMGFTPFDLQKLGFDKTGEGSGISTVQEDGVDVDTAATALNFEGSGVTVTTLGHVVTVSITGGGATHGPSYFLEDGIGYYELEDGTGVYLLE